MTNLSRPSKNSHKISRSGWLCHLKSEIFIFRKSLWTFEAKNLDGNNKILNCIKKLHLQLENINFLVLKIFSSSFQPLRLPKHRAKHLPPKDPRLNLQRSRIRLRISNSLLEPSQSQQSHTHNMQRALLNRIDRLLLSTRSLSRSKNQWSPPHDAIKWDN